MIPTVVRPRLLLQISNDVVGFEFKGTETEA